jgi:hypothetical protein
MSEYYKKFEYFYQKEKLEDLLKKLIEEKKIITQLPWIYGDPAIVLENRDILPMNHIFGENLSINDFGLAALMDSTEFHVNSKNNGLIVFPLSGKLEFNFRPSIQDTSQKIKTVIDSPTLVNGKIDHRYFPTTGVSMFYAIKIPPNISWDEICSIIDNDRQ